MVGVCVLIWMPDSPVHAQNLIPEERIAALERVRDDQVGTENKTIKKEQVIEALTDVRTWLIVLTTMLCTSACASDCATFHVAYHLASIPNGALSNCTSFCQLDIDTG